MKMETTVSVVVEKGGRVLASFPMHDAYFTVPPHLVDILRAAQKDGREVSFTYDLDLNILDVAG